MSELARSAREICEAMKLTSNSWKIKADTQEDKDFADVLEKSRMRSRRRVWNAPFRHLLFNAQTNRWPEWAATLESIKTKLVHGGTTIALLGERATGKTQMAVECMKFVEAWSATPLFDTAAGFFRAIKSTYSKVAVETESDVIKRFRAPALLVLDDLGKTGATEWEATQLFEVINLRYGDMTDTVITSNLNREAFSNVLGPSIVRRMNDTGGIVHCDWQ